ncbi:hypothetical protein C8R43DRAFT_1051335 [Mycena crocata]|nr:hypothetical protein C8R43DRAFT_1051335 [Mycena crocata]
MKPAEEWTRSISATTTGEISGLGTKVKQDFGYVLYSCWLVLFRRTVPRCRNKVEKLVSTPTSEPNSDSFALHASEAPGIQVPRPLPPVIVGDLRFKKVQKQLNSVTTQISAMHKLVKICCVCDTPAENKARNNLGELRRQDQVATTIVIQNKKRGQQFRA